MNAFEPTSPANQKLIHAMFAKISPLMSMLRARWADEKEHEDIADYAARIKKELPAGINLIAMTKHPFGFTFDVGTQATYKITTGANHVSWERIKPAKVTKRAT